MSGRWWPDPNALDYNSDEQKSSREAYFQLLGQHNDIGIETSHLPMLRFLYTTLLLAAALIFIKCGLAASRSVTR